MSQSTESLLDPNHDAEEATLPTVRLDGAASPTADKGSRPTRKSRLSAVMASFRSLDIGSGLMRVVTFPWQVVRHIEKQCDTYL